MPLPSALYGLASRALILCAMGLMLSPTDPARAQDERNGAAASGRNDIVVEGRIEAKKSAWKRAEADHVIVDSTGSEDMLKRVVTDLESLHRLMSRLYLRGNEPDDPRKIHITLLDDEAQLRAMDLRDVRSQEGPFSKPFSTPRYFDFGIEGDILAIARTNQNIKLDTSRRFALDCDDYQAGGGAELCGASPAPGLAASGGAHVGGTNAGYVAPAVRSWESRLYASYAQHFMLTYLPAAYPRWYLDAIGAFYSTIAIAPGGAIDYGRPPPNYQSVFRSYGYPDVGDIMTGRYLDAGARDASWSPYAAWLLGHYFIYANLKPDRKAQFEHYMASIRQGVPMADAAALFGNMRQLQREILAYARRPIAFAHAEPPPVPIDTPRITTLSAAQGALVEARLEVASRLGSAPVAPDPGAATTPSIAWVGQLSDRVAALAHDRDALLLAAEAACRGGKADDCLASAERMLSRSADDAEALAWKGVALTAQAIGGPVESRSPRLADARASIARAIQIDGEAPLPRIAYFLSFARAGEPVPQDAMRGIAQAIRSVPAAPAPRLYLGQELIREGQVDLARRLLAPLLYGAYQSPERLAAESLFSPPIAGLPN